jgi:hypothetical protein
MNMVKIFSREKWNDTKIDLIEGCQYKYKATGKWIDWFIECDADGYSNFFMNFLFGQIKRTPSAKWFQLVGVVDKDKSYTVELGTKGTFKARKSGRLFVYANDVGFAYRNNRGYVELEITQCKAFDDLTR